MYELCKRQIEKGCKSEIKKKEMMSYLGCFMMTGQITPKQYMELSNMLDTVILSTSSIDNEISPVDTEEENQ